MRLLRKSNLVFLLILLAYLLYAAYYIYKTSFIVRGERFFVLFDDAMISMRYAKNLAEGFGPVWNPGGERVEGYTNPLWVVFMAFFHLFPIPASKISALIQASGAVFLAANLFFVKQIAERLSGSVIVALLAVVLTAFYAPLNNWGLLGMEVSVLTLILSAAVWIGLENMRLKRFTPWLWLLLGVSTLVRVDMAVPYLLILGFLFLAQPEHRWKNLAWGLGCLALFLGGQTLFRWMYYGDLLPNTYYLKMDGYPLRVRVQRGFYVLFLFAWHFNWVLFLLPLSVLLFRRDRSVLFLFLVFLGQIAYSVYVGGDAWEHKGGANRYFSIAMPLFFTLFVYAIDLIWRRLILKNWPAAGEPARISGATSLYAGFGLAAFALASLVTFNVLIDFKSLERWTFQRQPDFIRGNEEYVRIALDLRQITKEDAKVAVVSAGAIPYFSERYSIDLLGKSDVRVAHDKPHNLGRIYDLELFRPGHMKWDYDYSIGKLEPDVIVQMWGNTDAAKPYLDQFYVTGGAGREDSLNFYLRSDAPTIMWEKIEVAQ